MHGFPSAYSRPLRACRDLFHAPALADNVLTQLAKVGGAAELKPPAKALRLPLSQARADAGATALLQMVKKERRAKEAVSREYTINLHKKLQSINFKKRAPRAVKEIKAFAKKMMGTKDVRIDVRLNKELWSKGIKNVPNKIRVVISRRRNDDEDAKVSAAERGRRHGHGAHGDFSNSACSRACCRARLRADAHAAWEVPSRAWAAMPPQPSLATWPHRGRPACACAVTCLTTEPMGRAHGRRRCCAAAWCHLQQLAGRSSTQHCSSAPHHPPPTPPCAAAAAAAGGDVLFCDHRRRDLRHQEGYHEGGGAVKRGRLTRRATAPCWSLPTPERSAAATSQLDGGDGDPGPGPACGL